MTACPVCGHENPDGATACAVCGHVEKPRAKGRRIAAIVLGVGGIFALACCGGVAYFSRDVAVNEVPAARSAVDAFYADLQAGRLSEAYVGTTAAFREIAKEDQFRVFAEAAPLATNHTSRTIEAVRVYGGTNGTIINFRVTLRGPGDSATHEVRAAKEGGAWKVDGAEAYLPLEKLNVKPDEPPPAPNGNSSWPPPFWRASDPAPLPLRPAAGMQGATFRLPLRLCERLLPSSFFVPFAPSRFALGVTSSAGCTPRPRWSRRP